jgi:hypothetical protein
LSTSAQYSVIRTLGFEIGGSEFPLSLGKRAGVRADVKTKKQIDANVNVNCYRIQIDSSGKTTKIHNA